MRLGATRKGDAFAGGVTPVQEWYAPSLTSNREAGIRQWDIADVVALLQTGIAKRGAFYGPMAQVVHDSLQHLTDSDARAMAVYLKSLVPQGAAEEPVQIRPTEQQSKALYGQGAKLCDRHCGGLPSSQRRRLAAGVSAACQQSVDRDGVRGESAW